MKIIRILDLVLTCEISPKPSSAGCSPLHVSPLCPQDLMSELDRQAKEMKEAKALSNGPVQTALSNGADDCPTPDERGAEEVAILEKKLEDLKSKNDVSSYRI